MRLETRDLSITYVTGMGQHSALRNVTIGVERGRTLGIVGESGSGKSTVASALMRLLPRSARIEGEIALDGVSLLGLSDAEMRRVRGKRIGMIMQDSLAALNPMFTVGDQLLETLRHHMPHLSGSEARRRVIAAFEEVGLDPQRAKAYPHQFSGGMRQRAMIAAALLPEPEFLIADESTSDLDTISQRSVLNLLKRVQETHKLGLIVITHDFGVVRDICADVAVFYRGDLIELGPTAQVLSAPQQEYTAGLVRIAAKTLTPKGRLHTLRAATQAAVNNDAA
jgi:ABC-type dipeptide/oligopeptide/nickel transport system ATPase component